MNIAIIDLVFLAIILWFVIVATIKGLIAEVFGKAAFVVGILIGLLFANDLYPSVGRGVVFDISHFGKDECLA